MKLLAVSKTRPASEVAVLYKAGQRDFGENYLQEALTKIPLVEAHITDTHSKREHQGKAVQDNACKPSGKVIWHFIGAIQSNKTRVIAEHFAWVHTLASSKIALRLHNQRPASMLPINTLLQVNIDRENTKAGLLVEEVAPFIESTQGLERLCLRGLMTIPSPNQDTFKQREAFMRLRQLKQSINEKFDLPQFDQLSMGMSADLEAAISEGTTILRIGTAIFGARTPTT